MVIGINLSENIVFSFFFFVPRIHSHPGNLARQMNNPKSIQIFGCQMSHDQWEILSHDQILGPWISVVRPLPMVFPLSVITTIIILHSTVIIFDHDCTKYDEYIEY